MDKRKAWLYGIAIVIAAVALFTGVATFDQWSAFVGGLIGGA